jgi:serine/threonine-protein kinase RIM15
MGPVMLAVRRIQQSQLENAHTALGLANAISTPSVKDEDSSNSISYQQLLSPASEDRLTFIGRWVKPETDDPALQLLFVHVDELIRRKQMTVNRMRNTIMYAERVRREWEDKMDRMLSIAEEEGSTSDHSSNADGQEAAAPQDQTPENALSISPSSAKRRVIDPKARLPPTTTTMQRQQSTHTVATIDGIAAADDRLPIPSPPIVKPPKRMSNSRRSSANRTHMEPPMSPRLPSVASMARTAPTSIKDFDIIKPISRGAFGSVYLAKKRTTGDYFAIKALKKSDMIAKNQITNVKAERTILMNQASSPYVAKLYFSFQNKDYLYLVMEYLNGGDCAALIKTLGGLPEEWARNYIAEVVLGLEYLHDRGIVHR